MKLRYSALISFIYILFIPFLSYAETIERIHLTRSDGSSLNGYLTVPDGVDSYPLAIIVHGSPCESVLHWHEDFKLFSLKIGTALITIEKQGVYSPTEIDMLEYDLTNTFEHRLEDHLFLIEQIRQANILPHWNGRMIMIGGSEGGRVAAAISAQTPEVVATALFTCGGGLSTSEELAITFTKFMKSHGESDAEIAENLDLLDIKLQEIIANPTHEKKFIEYTYKWWATHLNRLVIHDVLQIRHPLYYAHGTEDTVVPIESADKLAECLMQNGKTDFYYNRVEGYGHDMRTFPPEVVLAMMKMFEDNHSQLFPAKP